MSIPFVTTDLGHPVCEAPKAYTVGWSVGHARTQMANDLARVFGLLPTNREPRTFKNVGKGARL